MPSLASVVVTLQAAVHLSWALNVPLGKNSVLLPSPLRSSVSPFYQKDADITFSQSETLAETAQVNFWKLLQSGKIAGVAKNHPTIDDGDFITTSPIIDHSAAVEGGTVKTECGSVYKLGVAAPESLNSLGRHTRGRQLFPFVGDADFTGSTKKRNNGLAMESARLKNVHVETEAATINEWKILKSGAVVGIAKDHPTIYDGDYIRTSPIADDQAAVAGAIVRTTSGSRYKLGVEASGSVKKMEDAFNGAVSAVALKHGFLSIFGVEQDFHERTQHELGAVLTATPTNRIVTMAKLGETAAESVHKRLTGASSKHLFSVLAGNGVLNHNGKNEKSAATSLKPSAMKMVTSPAQIEEWSISELGEVSGFVKNHPSIADGAGITTSPIVNRRAAISGATVKTRSGSLYKLGVAASNDASSSGGSGGIGFLSVFGKAGSDGRTQPENDPTATVSLSKAFDFTAASIGNGKYLLMGRPRKSTSGKSRIWTAHRSDKNGNPVGKPIIIKLSANFWAMEQENLNYNKVSSGLFSGPFVRKLDFLPRAEDNQCALVLERGTMDLKELLASRGLRGLEGRAMRDAALAAGLCIRAMHSASMVWTDLKTENFVIVTESDGEEGLPGVKAIDLESARPCRSNPVDYSPEACPPEFADAFLSGYAAEFVLSPSYDIWSLGMMLYELSTGKPYFSAASPSHITKTLKKPDFVADVSKVEDRKLRNLLAKCLSRDPKARPSITQFLLHPYFTTSGIGPFAF